MKVILFGATGMVGQGVLRECLLDPDVERVLAVGRSPTGQPHAKLREIRARGFLRLLRDRIRARRLRRLLLLSRRLLGRHGRGALPASPTTSRMAAARRWQDSTRDGVHLRLRRRHRQHRAGPRMWARVKGKTENDLLKLPFRRPTCSVPRASSRCTGSGRRPPVRRSMSLARRCFAGGAHFAEVRHDDRAGRPRDAPRRRDGDRSRCWRTTTSTRCRWLLRCAICSSEVRCLRTIPE